MPKPPSLSGHFVLKVDQVIVDSSILLPVYKHLNESYGSDWDLQFAVECAGEDHVLQTQHGNFNAMLAYYTF